MVSESQQNDPVYLDQQMHEAQFHHLVQGDVAVYSCRSPLKEPDHPNEDAAAIIPFGDDAVVLVVADGMGGEANGDLAAKLAILALKQSVKQGARDDIALRESIMDGFEKANKAVCEIGSGAATTLTVAEIENNAVRPYHAGDSKLLVVGNHGKVKLKTVSHSPVDQGVEAGFIDEDDALHHEDLHLVSNYIGTPAMRIEVGSRRKLAPRDTVLLASDGLFDNLHNDEIIEHIRKGPLEKVADRLIRHAMLCMGGLSEQEPCKPDDLTFILYRRSA